MQPIVHKSCGVILFIERASEIKFLLLKYPHGHIDFAKGHIEENETLIDCARRELREETGIADIELIEGFMEQISYNYVEDSKQHYKTVDFFLAKSNTQNVTVSHEHTDFIWLDFASALDKLTFDNAKQLLIKAKSFLEL